MLPETNCRNCGAPIDPRRSRCEYCESIYPWIADTTTERAILYANDRPIDILCSELNYAKVKASTELQLAGLMSCDDVRRSCISSDCIVDGAISVGKIL